ncbi:MAG TPA: class I SAM-dependent methyltransferase [Prolixibacteraceae bacterium]|nr:class I SAM-dependent methyltransferase [Prolixibacteraceae bacterium]
MNRFDEKAATWDSNPANWDRAEAIAGKIREKINLSPEMIAMEYGAGTGILSFILKDDVKEITLMDNSIGMVQVMEEKIKKEKVAHLKPLFFNLETTPYRELTFDLIVTQMVMHHVRDVKGMIRKFYDLLHDGGSLAVADLYAEDGSFHGSGFDGHLGFDMESLSRILRDAGFKNVSHEPCYVVKKQTEMQGMKDFPVFIMTGVK